MIFFAIELITENPVLNVDICDEDSKKVIQSVCKNIHSIYKRIKKCENSTPNESVSTANTKATNSYTKIIDKINLINTVKFMWYIS